MNTTISKVSDVAGVICPKDTGELNPVEPCKKCQHFANCYSVILAHCEE